MAAQRSPRTVKSFVCSACRHQHNSFAASTRAFSSTPSWSAAPADPLAFLESLKPNAAKKKRPDRDNTGSSSRGQSFAEILRAPADTTYNAKSLLTDTFARNLDAAVTEKPHKFHVYATKHNTHITFVQPPRAASQTASSGISGTSASASEQKKVVDVLLSLSAGNIGFRKAGRGSYDAAYQLTAFALKQMQEKGMLRDVQKMEVVLRGFGAGREAVTKVLLGSEGRNVRRYISGVVDATRLKLGGPRSPKPRRLG